MVSTINNDNNYDQSEVVSARNDNDNYSEVPIIRPPMVIVENGLNNEQVLFK